MQVATERSSSPKKTEHTRDSLIRAAKTLFAQKGFDATSVKDIASAAGVNVSLVSYYFSGKNGLYKECLEEYGKTKYAIAERILKPSASTADFRLRLEMFVDETISNFIENPEIHQILHRDIELNNPLTHEVFQKRFLPIFQLVVEFLSAARKKGIIHKTVNPQNLAACFFGMITHCSRMDRVNQKYFNQTLKNPTYREAYIQQIIQLFCDGALNQPKKAKTLS